MQESNNFWKLLLQAMKENYKPFIHSFGKVLSSTLLSLTLCRALRVKDILYSQRAHSLMEKTKLSHHCVCYMLLTQVNIGAAGAGERSLHSDLSGAGMVGRVFWTRGYLSQSKRVSTAKMMTGNLKHWNVPTGWVVSPGAEDISLDQTASFTPASCQVGMFLWRQWGTGESLTGENHSHICFAESSLWQQFGDNWSGQRWEARDLSRRCWKNPG